MFRKGSRKIIGVRKTTQLVRSSQKTVVRKKTVENIT